MDKNNLSQDESQMVLDENQKRLIEELGLSELPIERQVELLTKMTEALLKRIFVETLEELSDADKEIYSQMIDEKASPEEMENFLREKIPDYENFTKKVVDDFMAEMKRNI